MQSFFDDINAIDAEFGIGGQRVLGEGDVEHLPAAALQAAKRGNVARADDAELEYIRRTQFGVKLADGEAVLGVPQRIVRGYGAAGRLAVEWCTMDGTKYANIDGQEITHAQGQSQPHLL